MASEAGPDLLTYPPAISGLLLGFQTAESGTAFLAFSFPEPPSDVPSVSKQPSPDSRPICLLLLFLSFSHHPFGLKWSGVGRGVLSTSFSSYLEFLLLLAYKKMCLVLDMMIMNIVLVRALPEKQPAGYIYPDFMELFM